VIQGTFSVIQGTFGVIQGTFGVIQGIFSSYLGAVTFGARAGQVVHKHCQAHPALRPHLPRAEPEHCTIFVSFLFCFIAVSFHFVSFCFISVSFLFHFCFIFVSFFVSFLFHLPQTLSGTFRPAAASPAGRT
jgi:hypothetical protein